MSDIFKDALKKQTSTSMLTMSSSSQDWLKNKLRNFNTSTNDVISKSRDRYRNRVMPGRMYLFSYDPKTKDTLPYYDKFPLIFPIEKSANGFLGLNFHYLPLNYRAILMDALYPLTVNENSNDESTRIRLTYSILSKMSKSRIGKVCVKHYLNNHIKSRFIYINPDEWKMSLFLPLQQFKKASVMTVYRDSLRDIKR